MIYPVVAVVLGLLAIIIGLIALRLLIGNWLLGWLRGTAGIALVLFALAVIAGAWDLRSYRQLSETLPIATLAFNKLDEQRFGVTLADQTGSEQRFELSGDLWQLDARVLRWTDALARLGLKPGYRADRLSGRYLSLSDEQKLPHTEIELRTDKPLLDVWVLLQSVNRHFSLLIAQAASATYLPMVDGALYSVSITPIGLVARPLNDRAKLALERWQ